MAINERYENVDDYRFVEKKSKSMKPRYRKIQMEDLFDDDDIIVDDELNEIDMKTQQTLSKDADSRTYYVPSSKIADAVKIKDKNANVVITNESTDDKIEVFYVMDSKGSVKNLSKTHKDADKFLEKSLKNNGKIGHKMVSKKDWDSEKITTSNIKTYKMNESMDGGCGCGGKKSINETINVQKTETGYLVLSKRLENGDLFKRRYMDYTEKEAKAKFRNEFNEENKKTLKEGGCGCGGGKKSLKENNEINLFNNLSYRDKIKYLVNEFGMDKIEAMEICDNNTTVDDLPDEIKDYFISEGVKKSIREADIMGRRSLPGIGGAAPGVGMYNKISKDNAKENKSAYEESMKKVSKYNDIKLKPQLVDNGGTAKTAAGDNNTKKYGVENDEAYIEELAKSGMNNLDLDYDREPSDKFKERVRKNLDGDESISMRIANKRKELQNKQAVYHTFYKDPKPMKDLVNNYKAFGKNKNVEESISSIVDRIIAEAIKMKEGKKSKPDFLDLDKDGNKKEPMKKAAKDAKMKKSKSKIFKKKEVKESEGWMTILNNDDMKEINSTPQPKVERPSANMSISSGFASINLGTLRVENAENLDKVVIPSEYQVNGLVFEIADNNRTAKVRFEEGELIVLADKNKKMINEETSKIMKLMNYNYNTKPAAKSVMKEDVNATLKKMLNEVKGLTKE